MSKKLYRIQLNSLYINLNYKIIKFKEMVWFKLDKMKKQEFGIFMMENGKMFIFTDQIIIFEVKFIHIQTNN